MASGDGTLGHEGRAIGPVCRMLEQSMPMLVARDLSITRKKGLLW